MFHICTSYTGVAAGHARQGISRRRGAGPGGGSGSQEERPPRGGWGEGVQHPLCGRLPGPGGGEEGGAGSSGPGGQPGGGDRPGQLHQQGLSQVSS